MRWDLKLCTWFDSRHRFPLLPQIFLSRQLEAALRTLYPISGTKFLGQMTPPAAKDKPEILVALLGVTGAGKTTFARLVSGDESLRVGHSIHSCE